MREIKFRAKDLVYNKWIYGGLAEDTMGNIAIVQKENWLQRRCVHKETTGQFTGLYDKNGKEIYEGDIVYHRTYRGHKACIVEFECGAFIVGYHEGSSTNRAPMLINKSCVVIGNIHDNPELLREEGKQ